MGAGASAGGEYSVEEKAALAKALQEQYTALKSSVNDDTVLFEALKETYTATEQTLKNNRDPSGEVKNSAGELTTDATGPDDEGDDSNSFSLKGSVKYHPFASSKGDGIGDMPESPVHDKPALGKFMKQKTSSELLSEMNENLQGDQEKIANFITQLKSGEVQTKQTSTFRARRLTYTQKTVDDSVSEAAGQVAAAAGVGKEIVSPKQHSKPTKVRTTIFASSEIGVVTEKKPPFPDDILGTYSCHGIEPAYDEENGIHEKINQDRGCAVYPYNGQKNEALFIVLDGHGEHGDKVSEFVMRQIVVSLEKDSKLNEDPINALKSAFVMTNTALLVTQIQYMTSGCTCVAVYCKDNTLYVANAGDSRAVMACEGADGTYTAKDLSRDHKPDDADEMERILKWGGYVCPPPEPGLSARVYLDPDFTMIGLAMARSIGDHAVKAVGVIPEPEVKTFEIESQDRFIIMASDGVWEFITSQEAVDIVQKSLHKGMHDACQDLIETAATRWQEEEGDYRDDITAIVVKVPLPYHT